MYVNVAISFIFRGKRSGREKYRLKVAAGYLLPLIITLLTLLVESLAPKCNWVRPRFAEEECFFSGTKTKISGRI